MEGKNLVLWNSIILGYLKVGKFEQCLELFQEMQLLGVKPDLVTVSSILGAYFQSGMVDEATSVFRELEERDEVCWTAMIVGYSQSGREVNVLVLFIDMMAENSRPNNYTISVVVSVCAKLASLGIGNVVHGKAFRIVIKRDLLVLTAFIDMYNKCGEILDAWIVFGVMRVRNVVSWNAMITG
ncbi:hypothetical protein GIB67_001990 [Kingdonia uniflora]|uniref:Pentatricopeptide repeat-containing protein n=1 Tax=Kingdonia uniflora TaxID=39325 RepID=A0A7J7MA07_9MAGN|nr:hypothetical protein GIB67_001990 [Kingdonia uniflora]